MTKFVYKFDSIRRIKETLENKIRKEVSLIENEIEVMNCRMKNVKVEIEKNKKSFTSRKNVKASELQFQTEVENLLQLDAANIQKEIIKLENQKQVKLNELVEKSKECKMFETLENKHLEDFIFEQNHIEQKILDEMAVIKYIRED